MIYTIFKVEEPERNMVNNMIAEDFTPTTGIPNTKCNWMNSFLKICGILFLCVMVICTFPLLVCGIIQMGRKLTGEENPKNVTTPPVITPEIAHYISLMTILLGLGILLCSYVSLLIIRAVHFPEKPKLEKIVVHAKRSVIPKGTGKPQEEKAKPEKKSVRATTKTSNNNSP